MKYLYAALIREQLLFPLTHDPCGDYWGRLLFKVWCLFEEIRYIYLCPFLSGSQDRTAVSFMVGDACQLPDLGQFGCVLAANLICRLPEPTKFFQQLPDMIVPGGILVITSPYTWLEQYTPKVHGGKNIGRGRDGGREGEKKRESSEILLYFLLFLLYLFPSSSSSYPSSSLTDTEQVDRRLSWLAEWVRRERISISETDPRTHF